jgi:hypothetical protein
VSLSPEKQRHRYPQRARASLFGLDGVLHFKTNRSKPPMRSFALSIKARRLLGLGIGSVWLFHGLYSKILDGIPRHRMIVGRILGENSAHGATVAIGVLEVSLGLWAVSGYKRWACALVQSLAIVGMNTVEIIRANDLLISAPGMVVFNLAFLSVVWFWALAAPRT